MSPWGGKVWRMEQDLDDRRLRISRARLRECLASDAARLREVVASLNGSTPVPSCPGWTVTDLVGHVAAVYLHKVECMVGGVEPDAWPPEGLSEEAESDPLGLLDRAYAALGHELDTRPPEAPSGGWYAPDLTAGFWTRRMAQETVIHRLDAELAAGVPAAPIPDDLAVDGIDEFLYVFLEYGTTAWLEWAREVLADTDGAGVRLVTTGGTWLIRPTPDGVHVTTDGAGASVVEVSAAPGDMLQWVWGRAGDEAVTVTGDAERIVALRKIFTFVAQ
jgi:uncharacterized protein (TIGR03083 family)